MQQQSSLLLNYKRIVCLNLFICIIIALVCSWKLEIITSLQIATVIFLASIGDFSLFYVSILRALKEKPEKSLMLMRQGMLRRFLFALIATLVAIKINFMPWAILLGILIGHVILLVEGIVGGLRTKNKLEKL